MSFPIAPRIIANSLTLAPASLDPASPDPASPDNEVRAFFALFAESSDHAWRMLEDATLTAFLCWQARSPTESLDILETWQRRIVDDQAQHVGQVMATYTRLAEAQFRRFQLSLSR